jgi:hypothetical protein
MKVEGVEELGEDLETANVGSFERAAEVLRYWFDANIWPKFGSATKIQKALISIHDSATAYDLIAKKEVKTV